jgi:hypothetical protein
MNHEIENKMVRVRSGIQKYVNCEKMLFVFAKSNNDNCIVFLYDDDNNDDPLVPMWLHLEPKDMEKDLLNGNTSLMSFLNEMENELVGCELIVDDDTGKFFVKLNQSGMQDRNFELVMDSENKPAVLSTISGTMCRLDYGFCQFKEGIMMIPDHFVLNGTDLQTGEKRWEKIDYKL